MRMLDVLFVVAVLGIMLCIGIMAIACIIMVWKDSQDRWRDDDDRG